MKINYMRAARTLACGTYAYDAEMKVEIDNNKVLFLHANYSDAIILLSQKSPSLNTWLGKSQKWKR